MTSVPPTKEQLIRQRELDLMLYLGEVVAVEDPESGEVHYMATQALLDKVEGRCVAVEMQPRARHVKEAPKRGWLRNTMLVMAVSVIVAVALPTVTTGRGKPGVHRVVDDGADENTSVSNSRPMTVSAIRPDAVAGTTRVNAVPGVPVVHPGKRRPVRALFACGTGRHRAIKSNMQSNDIPDCTAKGWSGQGANTALGAWSLTGR